MQSLNKQNVDNVQHRRSRDRPKMKFKGNSRGNCIKTKGDYQDGVHSDQMVLMIFRRGGWTAWPVKPQIRVAFKWY
jgi:hypothetical protein